MARHVPRSLVEHLKTAIALAGVVASALAGWPGAASASRLGSGGRADGTISIELAAVGPTGLPQGQAFTVRATATNSSGSSQAITVVLQLVDPSSSSVGARSWKVTVPGQGQATQDFSMVPAQWFAATGLFTVQAVLNGQANGLPLSLQVKQPTVVLPVFQDVTDAVGLSTILPNDSGLSHAAGAAWGDVNLDGFPDLYVPSRTGPSQLWVYQPSTGGFRDEATQWGALNPGASGVAAVFADEDNDGDPDLYVANDAIDPATALPTMQGNRLYRNEQAQGTSAFTDVSASAGVETQGNGVAAAWGDYDDDGFLDLYVVNNNTYNEDGQPGPQITYYLPDHLFHNDGDGTFSEVSCDVLSANDPNAGFCPDPAFGGTTGSGFQAVWIDYDLDGDQDLFVAQDYFRALDHLDTNRLYRNDGFDEGTGHWTFTDVCAQDPTRDECYPINAMGIAVGDYDGDLLPDLAVSNTGGGGGNYLLHNNGDGTFTDMAKQLGVERVDQDAAVRTTTWGMGFEDFNLDGTQDLYVTAGSNKERYNQPNELFVNTSSSRFLDLSAPSGTNDPGVAHGVAFADYDRDGLMDMYVVNVFGSGDVSLPILYRNVTPTTGHWLEVDLVGVTVNRDGCGARVVVIAGQKRLARWMVCGSSQGSGDDSVLHFGLTGPGGVRLRVEWPGGGLQTVRLNAVDRLVVVTQA
jgi:enediyne biosynthesis protein E4